MINNTLDFLFCGDFAPCHRFENIVIEHNENVFGDALTLIKNSHASFANLECPLTTSNCPIAKSGPNLRAHPDCIHALKPFSLIGLANNHIMDFGNTGLKSTIDTCNSINLPTTGIGSNLFEARRFHVITVEELSVAIIAIAEHEFNQAGENTAGSASIDVIDNYHQIIQAKKSADMVIVTLHGGNEYFPYPRPGLRKLCQHYIDLGVEAVVCHHPHVPGAYEYYNGKPIFYSLGNLIFDNPKPTKDWDLGYMVKLEFNKQKKIISNTEIIPYKQSIELGGLKLLAGEEKDRLIKRIESYRMTLETEEIYMKKWKNFVKMQSNNYLLSQYSPILFRGIGYLSRKLPLSKLFINKNNINRKLNLVRCESHLELLTNILE